MERSRLLGVREDYLSGLSPDRQLDKLGIIVGDPMKLAATQWGSLQARQNWASTCVRVSARRYEVTLNCLVLFQVSF